VVALEIPPFITHGMPCAGPIATLALEVEAS